MTFGSKHLLTSVRIALFAILMAALAPSISHLLAAANGEHAAHSCHGSDSQAGDGADRAHGGHGGHGGSPADPHAGHHGGAHATAGTGATGAVSAAIGMFEDCGYCSMQFDLPALPPLPALADAALPIVRCAPAFLRIAAPPLLAWTAAQPRAPPLP